MILCNTAKRRQAESAAKEFSTTILGMKCVYAPMEAVLARAVLAHRVLGTQYRMPMTRGQLRDMVGKATELRPIVSAMMEGVCRTKLTGALVVQSGDNSSVAIAIATWLKNHGLNLKAILDPTLPGVLADIPTIDVVSRLETPPDVIVQATVDVEELEVLERRIANSEVRSLNFLGKPCHIDRSRMESFRGRHVGETMIVLGNGPSVQVQDLDAMVGHCVFAANRFHMAYGQTRLRPTYTACADMLMMEQHGHEILANCETPLFLQSRGANHLAILADDSVTEYDIIPRPKGPYPQVAFSTDCSKGLGNGASIVYDMVQLAVWMGAAKIVLYGIDHSFSLPNSQDPSHAGASISEQGESNHFIAGYRSRGEHWYSPVTDVIEKGFEVALSHCNANGIELLNATRGGFLETLPRVNIDAILSTEGSPIA